MALRGRREPPSQSDGLGGPSYRFPQIVTALSIYRSRLRLTLTQSPSEVSIRPTRQSELPWFPSSSLGTSQFGALNGQTSVSKPELGNQGARTDGFGECLPSEGRNLLPRLRSRLVSRRPKRTNLAAGRIEPIRQGQSSSNPDYSQTLGTRLQPVGMTLLKFAPPNGSMRSGFRLAVGLVQRETADTQFVSTHGGQARPLTGNNPC